MFCGEPSDLYESQIRSATSDTFGYFGLPDLAGPQSSFGVARFAQNAANTEWQATFQVRP